ncbi:flavin-containing monooxygenase [Mycolicibacterium baixiangningiae]|uniref:flavin-containing monooxygenase n=1 Tax=Mycolicibacterium baixiangningiae TaxID=2761578 RepID=UPI001867B33C|nr:NAD(P)/FAD-dependent oxidoreductase [Mycolicibacterium baixiangningiae]
MTGGQFDVVIVGAGFSGIGTAIQLRKMGYDNIAILERGSDLGGTWHVNRYPGLAVDIPSPTYCYWFEPNPYWSRLFAPGAELKKYADHVADKYDVRRHMRFDVTVDSARWDEDAEVWRVLLRGGEVIVSRFLIAATGFLSQPQSPDIPGLADFRGRTIHTAAWDDGDDLTGRRVGIVGTGATAVQLIPELAKNVADLTVFQRTAIYVAPKNDFAIPGFLQRMFAKVPLTQRIFRLFTDSMYELMFVLGVLHYRSFRWLNVAATDLSKILLFASVRDRELRRKLTPDYEFGCKRPTYSNSYYRTFTKPHVHLQTSGIERVEADGIVACDGTRTALDTLVLATGFNLWDDNFPAVEIIGRDGRNLGKWWRTNGFQAYQGLSIPYFPNFLNLASPYAFSLSFFNTMEYQMRHMDRLFGELRRRNASTFEVTEDANARFLDRMTKLQRNTVLHQGDCANARSYYFSPGGETFLRATSTHNTVTEQTRFPLSDYVIA